MSTLSEKWGEPGEGGDGGASIDRLMLHREWLRALSRRLVGSGLADDLEQETWLAAVRRPPDSARPARPWLASVARRLAARLRGARADGVNVGDVEPESPAPSSEDLLAKLETESRLAREVSRLDEPFRRTVLLRYHEGLSAAEIARLDRVPAGTVRWRLKHGLDALRARLDREYGDRKSWAAVLAGLAGVEAGGAGAAALAWKATAAAAAIALALGGAALWRARDLSLERLPTVEARDDAALVTAAPATPDAGGGGARDPLRAVPRDASTRMPVAAAPGDADEVPPVRLLILHEDGEPAADLLVLLRRRAEEGELLFDPQRARTDSRGRVAFEVSEPAPLEVAVVRPAGPSHVVELAPNEAEQRIVLPSGARLAGRVRVDGDAPAESLVIEIYASEESVDATFSSHPVVVDSFRFAGVGPMTARTDVNGRFVFEGLPADWHGTLRLPRGFAEPGTPSALDPNTRVRRFVPEPTDELVLDVVAFPRVRGRIVEADGVTPVAEGSIAGRVAWADQPDVLEERAAHTGDEGGFELFFTPGHVGGIQLLELDYVAIPDRGRVERTWTRAQLPAEGELGDLALAAGRSVLVRFVDPDGAPIEGALIAGRDGASDANGELVVDGLVPEAASVRGGAFGFESRTIELPPNAAEARVELARANRLDVLVLGRDGAPEQGAYVELHAADGPFFVSERARTPDPLTSDRYAGHWASGWSGEDGCFVLFQTDREGRFSTGEVRAEVELRLRVPDACGGMFFERHLAPLGAGEHREIVARLDRDPRTLRVRVVDGTGAPLANSSVRLRAIGPTADDSAHGVRATVDDEGRFAFGRLAGDAYLATASKRGYVAMPPVRMPADGVERELVLERGLDVVVLVRDAEGAPVGGGAIRVPSGADAEPIAELEAGRFDLAGLSDAPVEVTLELAGATYVQRCDPRTPELRFDVPVHGALAAAWSPKESDAGAESATLVVIPRDGSTETRRWLDPDRASTRRVTPLLPGGYVVVVRALGHGGVERDLSAPVPIEVHAGETARVALEPLD